MFGLIVRFTLKGGSADDFDRLTAETVQAIRTEEPGTLVYACHRVDDRPGERIFYELYRDRQAFDSHERMPHVRRFLSERSRYVERTTVDYLTMQDGKVVLSATEGPDDPRP